MLSLVNAATVAFDLVRLPDGAEAADVLLAALNAGPEQLAALDHHASSRTDGDRIVLAVDRAVARLALSEGGPLPAAEALAELAAEISNPDTSGPSASAVRVVATVPLCRGTDLATLLTDDILDWTRAPGDPETLRLWPHGVEALLDAFTAALAAPALTADQHERLTAPMRQAGLPAGAVDLGPNHTAVASLLALADGIDPGRAAVVARRHDAEPGWALAMHRACWAVYLSGRIRVAAAAQFALARTVARRPDRLRLATQGAFPALSGAVHAEMVADLLDDASSARLLAPLGS